MLFNDNNVATGLQILNENMFVNCEKITFMLTTYFTILSKYLRIYHLVC